jgi:hypothetical protein
LRDTTPGVYLHHSSGLGDFQLSSDAVPVRGFQGYVDFFLLQDLVSSECEAVRFFMPFNDFNPSAIPRDLGAYLEFRHLSIEFAKARIRRIDQLALNAD